MYLNKLHNVAYVMSKDVTYALLQDFGMFTPHHIEIS
jgi:hypothetical protein